MPQRLVWFEYPATHFPWGLGEFEDWQRWNETERPGIFFGFYGTRGHIAGPLHMRNNSHMCRPLGPCVSNATVTRLDLNHFYARRGVPILRTWDMTFDRFDDHPSRADNPSDRDFEMQIDCRHFCVPGAAADAMLQRLHAMLHPAIECSSDSADTRVKSEASRRSVECLQDPTAVRSTCDGKGTPTCATFRPRR